MRRLSLAALLWLAAAAAHAASWSDLWLTRDQQAQRLLDSRQPAAAAPLFSDARHQAYARLQAGQYAKAADLLAPFKDADSLYNRGNALAHTGQLEEALKAYDEALAVSPGNKDTLHNRELVKRALEQQSQASPQRNGGSQPGGGQGQKGSNSRGGGSSGGQDRQSSADRSGSGQDPAGRSGQSPTQSGAASQPNTQAGSQATGQQQSGDNHSGHQGNQAESGSQAQERNGSGAQSQANAQSAAAGQASNPPGGSNSPQQGAGSQAPSPTQGTGSAAAGDLTQQPRTSQSQNGAQSAGGQASGPDSETARQDAAAGIRYQESQGRAADARNTTPPNRLGPVDSRRGAHLDSNNTPPPQPPSEQTLALDQWLRGIPEDSGELLRRKFLIEHMMRQQGDAQ